MKFTVLTENLAKSLAIVNKAVPLKHSFPILTNVLVETKDGRLRLSGTNFDTSIRTYVAASVEEEGSITIPAKEFAEFLSHLSGESINLSLKKDIVNITSGKTKTKFNGITSEDYPDLPVLNEEVPFIEIAAKEFSSAVSHVGFSVASDESRPVFGGIYLAYKEGILFFVASDGYRLSEKIMPLEAEIPDFSVIIPAKTVLEVSRVLGSSEHPIRIYLDASKNLCMFQSGDVFVATRIIDGAYPDYKRIIPKESVVTAKFDAAALNEAVKLTNVFTKNSSNSLTLQVSPDGFLRVFSTGEEMGENSTEVPAEVAGEAIEVLFNSKYLLDFLSNNKYERLQLSIQSANSPCLLKPIGIEDFIHVMAPLNANN